MLFFQLLPAFLSLLALAAHYLRGGHLVLAGLTLGAVALLLVPRRWAGGLVQAVLVLGVPVWLLQTWVLVLGRQARGEPYGRLMLILGGVAAFCALSALLLRRQRARRWFQAERASAPAAQSAAS